MIEEWYCAAEHPPTPDDADENGRVLAWHVYQYGILCDWSRLRLNRFITHWMPLRAFDGKWIDVRTRMPNVNDADALSCVLARHAVDGIVVIGWFQIPAHTSYTHFARLPDAPVSKA